MKNYFFFAVFCLLAAGCAKEPNAPVLKTAEPSVDAADRDNCSCAIRVDVPFTLGVSHEFNILINFGIPYWFGYITPEACGGVNIASGVWYPITLQNDLQYQMNYAFKQPCTTLKSGNATFSIRCGNVTTTFPLQTGNSAATNPDIVYFSKHGCVISEGIIY